MIKYNDKEVANICSKLNFYDFQQFCSIDGDNVKIEFSNHFEYLTYSDLNYGSNREIFERKQKLICELMNSIFRLVQDNNCFIIKYNERWIVNKRKSIRLYKILRKNNIKNKRSAAVSVEKYDYEIELFIRSVLKYNSFVQFIFLKDNMIISVTDHIDIFISFIDKKFVQALQGILDELNSKYSKSESCYSVFSMITCN